MARAILKSKATLDSRDFNTKIAGMNQKVGAFTTGSLARLGSAVGAAFAIGAVTRFAKSQLAAADRTADLVSILGVSAEAFQALENSALKYGGTVAQVEKGLQTLRKSQGMAAQGLKAQADAFERLGVTTKEINKLGTAQMLDRVARGYRNASNRASALADVQALLGRSGIELAGVLDHVGGSSLQTIIDQGKEAGTVLENDVIAQFAALNNELEVLERQMTVIGSKGLGNILGVSEADGKKWGAIGGALMGARMGAAAGPWGMFGGAIAGGLGGGYLGGKTGALFEKSQAIAGQAHLDELRKKRIGEEGGGAADPLVIGAAAKIVEQALSKLAGITVAQPKAADNLAAIGGFIGGQTSPALGALERAAKSAEITASTNKAIRELAEKNGVTLEEIRAALEE